MRNLNSVIIEGTLLDAATKIAGTKGCIFTLVHDTRGKHRFDIEVLNKNLSEYCLTYGYKHRGVKVVGRLKEYRDDEERSRVVNVAEHMEFRPKLKRNENGWIEVVKE
jgi:hypothetical protein